MSNPHRGEVEIRLGSRTWTMRPTHEAIVEIEEATGLGILGVYRLFLTRDIKYTEMAAVIACGLRAGGERQASERGVRQLLWEEGLDRDGLYTSIQAFLEGILRGGREPDPDLEPDQGGA